MGVLRQLFLSSVGKKILMGISGFLVVGFLAVHFIGNLFMYVGPEAFNRYAYTLSKNESLFVIMESVLALLFLWHIILGITLYFYGKAARPVSYVMKRQSGRGATWSSSTMPYTGSLILIFLVLHIWHFRLGPVYNISYDGIVMRDLYRLMLEFFQNSFAMVVLYIASMCAIGFHLSHGFQSAFQSLGWNHPRYTPLVQKLGFLVALFVVIGFSSFPVWAYLKGVN